MLLRRITIAIFGLEKDVRVAIRRRVAVFRARLFPLRGPLLLKTVVT